MAGLIELERLALTMSDGCAYALGPSNMSLPLTCQPGDSLSFVYNLSPNHSQRTTPSGPPQQTLSFALTACLRHANSPPTLLKTTGTISIDLSTLQQSSTPLLQQPNANPTTTSTAADTLSQLINFTITSQPTITVGSTLHWFVLLANRSTTRTLRLALTPISQHTSSLSASTTTAASVPTSTTRPPSTSSLPPTTPAPAKPTAQTAKLIPLTPSLPLGPIPPGTSTTAILRFLVLSPGTGGVRCLRITDMDDSAGGRRLGETTGGGLRWVDLRGAALPDVLVVEGKGDELRDVGGGGEQEDKGDDRGKEDKGDDRGKEDKEDDREKEDKGDDREKEDKGEDLEKEDKGDDLEKQVGGDGGEDDEKVAL